MKRKSTPLRLLRPTGEKMYKRIPNILFLLFLILASACSSPSNQTNITNIPELDHVIETVLHGDKSDLDSIIAYTQTQCVHAEGLGGFPKCRQDEAEGTRVEVLPFLGPEGSFIRKEDMGSWEGLKISQLFSVYENSDTVYSDPNYPAGEYAIVFTGKDGQASVTLQIRDGKIVRIDHAVHTTPNIRMEDVKKFIIPPLKTN
jgi:hypothetical protein